MEFRTDIKIDRPSFLIDHTRKGLSLGSCFAENISERMRRAKFPVTGNPFGVLYNPLSVARALYTLHCGSTVSADRLVEEGGLWHSFDFHGSFSSPDKEAALAAMNASVEHGSRAIREADYVILTFGTAWVYELSPQFKVTESQPCQPQSVANCHKFPSNTFVRRRLSVKEIVETYENLLEGPLRGKNTIITVSPVRHLKDGFHGNTLSKATLHLAVGELAQKYASVWYFPAYEIMNDDLRDYRFYDRDMVHPSTMAIDYIWNRFAECAFTPEAVPAVREFEKLAEAMEHRPINPGTPAHKAFLDSMYRKTEELQRRYPSVDLSPELDRFGG